MYWPKGTYVSINRISSREITPSQSKSNLYTQIMMMTADPSDFYLQLKNEKSPLLDLSHKYEEKALNEALQ